MENARYEQNTDKILRVIARQHAIYYQLLHLVVAFKFRTSIIAIGTEIRRRLGVEFQIAPT